MNSTCTCSCKNTGLTCSQSCQAKGYTNSRCNMWATGIQFTDPNTGCKACETNLGWTSDCTAAGISGGGRACCCSTETPPSICSALGRTCPTPVYMGSWTAISNSSGTSVNSTNQCCAGLMCKQSSDAATWTCQNPTPVCGNGICEAGEADVISTGDVPSIHGTCPKDCGGTCYTQGQTFFDPNGTCCGGLQRNYFAYYSYATPTTSNNGSTGSSITTTNSTSGQSSQTSGMPAPSFICDRCGDGKCENGENTSNCPQDCATIPHCIESGAPVYLGQSCCSGLVAGYSNGCTNSSCPQFCQKPTCSASLNGDACRAAGGTLMCSDKLCAITASGIVDPSCTGSVCSCSCPIGPVGGNCTYKTYPGQCTITAVTPDNSGSAGVNYTFTPTGNVDLTGTFLESSGAGQISPYKGSTAASYLGLTCLKGPYDPTPSQVSACGVVTGAAFACSLSVETTGTCTPINVSFTAGGTVTTGSPSVNTTGTTGTAGKTSALQSSIASISASLSQIMSQLMSLLGK